MCKFAYLNLNKLPGEWYGIGQAVNIL